MKRTLLRIETITGLLPWFTAEKAELLENMGIINTRKDGNGLYIEDSIALRTMIDQKVEPDFDKDVRTFFRYKRVKTINKIKIAVTLEGYIYTIEPDGIISNHSDIKAAERYCKENTVHRRNRPIGQKTYSISITKEEADFIISFFPTHYKKYSVLLKKLQRIGRKE